MRTLQSPGPKTTPTPPPANQERMVEDFVSVWIVTGAPAGGHI